MTRFRKIICGAAFICVLCLTAVCLAENQSDSYAGTWDLASYRAYKTVLAGPSPTMGLDLSGDGSGSLRLRSGATIPVNWKADEYGLRISADSAAVEEWIDGRLYIDYESQRVIVRIRQDAVTISEVYIFRHTADSAGNPIQPDKSVSELFGCWKSSSDGRKTNDDVTLCIGANGEGLLIEQYPMIGRKLDVLQCLPSEEAGCICILDSFGKQHTASLDRGVLRCDFTSERMLKTEEYDGVSRFTYSLIDNGEHVALKSYMYEAPRVTIPTSVLGKPVTALASYLFAKNDSLVEVVVPEGFTILPEGIFSGCGNLSSVQFPDSLKEIGKYAFAGCNMLEQLYIPAGVEMISSGDGSSWRNDTTQLIVEHDTYAASFARKNGLPYLVSAIDREEGAWEAWKLSSALNTDGDACSLGECGISGETFILLNSMGCGILYSDGYSRWFVHDPGDAENPIPSDAVCTFVHADDGTLQFDNPSGALIFSGADDRIIEQALAVAEEYWDPKSYAVADMLNSITVPIHYEKEEYFREWSGTWIAESTSGQAVYMCRLEMDGNLDCYRMDALYLPSSVNQSWQMHWCPTGNGISIWQGEDRSTAWTSTLQNGQLEVEAFGEPGLRFSRCDAYGNLLDSLGADAERKFAAMLGMWTSERSLSDDSECAAQLTLCPNGTAHWRRVEWSGTGMEAAQLYETMGEWTYTEKGVSFTSEEVSLIFSVDGEALSLQAGDESLKLLHTADLGAWTGSGYRGEKLAEYLQTAYVGMWESNNLDSYGNLTATVCLAADGSARLEVCSGKTESETYDADAYPMRWWPTESGIGFEAIRSVPKLLLSAGESYDMHTKDGCLEWAIPGYGTAKFERITDTRMDAVQAELICGFGTLNEAGDSSDDLDTFAVGRSYAIGDTVCIGRYEQDGDAGNGAEPIEWRILNVEENRVLLLSEYILWTDCFHDDHTNFSEWEDCSLNEKLNGDFLQNAFTAAEAEGIQTTRIPIEKFSERPDEIENRIFLLSAEEVERYLYNRQDRLAQMSVAAYQGSRYHNEENGYSPWWLRSSGYIRNIDEVTARGSFLYSEPKQYQGVRPAMWYALPENASISGTPDQTVALPSDPGEYYAGNTICFGTYEQDSDSRNGAEPIEWRILSVDSDGVLLISENVLEMQLYLEDDYDKSIPWHRTDLYIWLNGRFLEKAFSAEDRRLLRGFDEELWNGTSDTRVTLLSAAQTEYFFPDAASRVAEPSVFVDRQYPNKTDNGASWWVRIDSNPIQYEDAQLVSVKDGMFADTMLDYSGGVRPVIRIAAPTGVLPSSIASEPQIPTISAVREEKIQIQEQKQNEAASPDSFRWEVRGDGIAILQYKGSNARVVVPAEIDGQPVKAIADGAFAELGFLKEVILPDGIASVGTKAFYKCAALEMVQLPSSVMDFGKFTFNNCPKLVLRVISGSFAQEYAASKKLKFTTESDTNE